MFRADCHMHSLISKDSRTPRPAMAGAAAKLGLNEICFTDHYDVIDFDGSYNPTFDWAPVRVQQQAALAAWGDSLYIGCGIEMGNVPRDFAAADRVLEEPGLDFVLCSVHNLPADMDGTDFYEVHYDSPELCYAHLDAYFAQMLQSVAWGHFDVLAHVPYPLRYMRARDGQPVGLDRYRDTIRDILKGVISNGSGLEINTKGWADAAGDYRDVLALYRDLGGEILTVGSDAHEPERVGADLECAYDLIRSFGYRYVAVYRGRVPQFHKI